MKRILLTLALAFLLYTPALAQERPNFCLDAKASASASSTYQSWLFPPSSVIDGERRGLPWGDGGGWSDATHNTGPDIFTVDLGEVRAIQLVRVYTLADEGVRSAEPTTTTAAGTDGIKDFSVELLDADDKIVATQSVANYDKALKEFTFAAGTRARKIRVTVTGWRANFSRLTEVEAYPPR